jgi:FtsZ-interacting cell division protein ZipA
MIQRIALLVGGLGAAAVLAIALGAGNLITFGAQAPTAQADSQPVAADVAVANSNVQPDTSAAAGKQNGTRNDASAQTQTKTKTVVDKVYIAPAPSPKVIHVNPATPPAPPVAQQPTAPPAANAPRSHDDGGYNDDQGERQSEHDGHNGDGHERGDD